MLKSLQFILNKDGMWPVNLKFHDIASDKNSESSRIRHYIILNEFKRCGWLFLSCLFLPLDRTTEGWKLKFCGNCSYTFTRDVFFKIHNKHTWLSVNPNATYINAQSMILYHLFMHRHHKQCLESAVSSAQTHISGSTPDLLARNDSKLPGGYFFVYLVASLCFVR